MRGDRVGDAHPGTVIVYAGANAAPGKLRRDAVHAVRETGKAAQQVDFGNGRSGRGGGDSQLGDEGEPGVVRIDADADVERCRPPAADA